MPPTTTYQLVEQTLTDGTVAVYEVIPIALGRPPMIRLIRLGDARRSER